jgi:DNA-binding NarL/FixJ family response regulator
MAHAAAPIPFRPAARGAANNLPAQFTSFIGREHDRAEITHLLRRGVRLVTLTGAGGVGKTRLAQDIGVDLLGTFRDGVWLLELAPVADGRRVPQMLAAVVGVHDELGRELLETLVAALHPRQLLVVLDNCEHLLQASAELVVRLLGGCPGISILATSRERLGLAGETTWRVPSLDVPNVNENLPIDRLLVAAAQRRPERVLRLLGATEAVRVSADGPPPSEPVRAALSQARQQLGSERADTLVAEGAALSVDEAIACAREDFSSTRAGVGDGSGGPAALTHRELEVVRLLGRGLANRQIATELVISVRTVDRHVENILAKLELSSRGQIVVWAAARRVIELPTLEPRPLKWVILRMSTALTRPRLER